MRKTPVYSIVLLVGLGFFFGLLFADLSHDLQVDSTPESVQHAVNYYNIMIEKNKKRPPILFIAVGLVGLSAIFQFFKTKNRVLSLLFALNLAGLLWFFVDVTMAELKLLKETDGSLFRGYLTRIMENHLLITGLNLSLLLVVVMIIRSDKQEHNPPKNKDLKEKAI
jgi:hypothetical protein